MNIRGLIAAIAIATTLPAAAQNVKQTFRGTEKVPLVPGGSLLIENPVGSVQVIGVDEPNADVTIITTITGVNAAAVEDGRRQTKMIVGGNERARVLRAAIAPNRGDEWSASMAWTVRVPRTTHVRVISRISERIRVTGIRGGVHVNNFNGTIVFQDVSGAATADSVNGSIIYITDRPRGNVVLSTVNGHITASVAANADFRWIAETAKGDIRTNLPARGAFFGVTFRGSVNAPGGPTLTTASLMGNIDLIASGTSLRDAQSLRQMPGMVIAASMASNGGAVTRDKVEGLFTYSTNIGDVRVQQIVGDADVFTGAGEVQIGSVSGACKVRSYGGPLQLGEVLGKIIATTRAGDILIDTARSGGTIATKGGTIRLFYTSGPTQLVSDGGDIIVRQAAASVNAMTRSGDITIAVDPGSKSEKVEARTLKGNIVLHVNSNFGADIDATIVTTDPNADTIASDIPGLSISRDHVGGKTRIRATGKLNGGGQRVVLDATGGDIRISTAPIGPTVVRPR